MKTFLAKAARKVYRKICNPHYERWGWCTIEEREETNRQINELLLSDYPCFIGRMGVGEGNIVNNYLMVHSKEPMVKKLYNYIVDNNSLPWWDVSKFSALQNNAGFFAPHVGIN